MKTSVIFKLVICVVIWHAPKVTSDIIETTEGQTFYFSIADCYNSPQAPSQLGQIVEVYMTSSSAAATVTVFSRATSPNTQTVNVAAGSANSLSLQFNETVVTSGKEQKGVKVTSTSPISVYVYVMTGVGPTSALPPHASLSYLVFPNTWLGTEYLAVTHVPDLTGNSFGPFKAFVSVTATVDNTVVDLMQWDTAAGAFTTLVSTTLQEYETYTLSNDTDLTGIKVSASQSVAVVSGNVMANPPWPNGTSISFQFTSNPDNSDPIAEMLPPISRLGTTYVTVPSDFHANKTTYRVVATAAGTVQYGSNTSSVSYEGDYVLFFPTATGEEIICSSPCLVAHVQGADGSTTSAYMAILPPVEYFGGGAIFPYHSLFTTTSWYFVADQSQDLSSVTIGTQTLASTCTQTLASTSASYLNFTGASRNYTSAGATVGPNAVTTVSDNSARFLTVFVQEVSGIKTASGHVAGWMKIIPESPDAEVSNAWVIGVAVGAFILLAVIAAVIAFVVIKKKNQNNNAVYHGAPGANNGIVVHEGHEDELASPDPAPQPVAQETFSVQADLDFE